MVGGGSAAEARPREREGEGAGSKRAAAHAFDPRRRQSTSGALRVNELPSGSLVCVAARGTLLSEPSPSEGSAAAVASETSARLDPRLRGGFEPRRAAARRDDDLRSLTGGGCPGVGERSRLGGECSSRSSR